MRVYMYPSSATQKGAASLSGMPEDDGWVVEAVIFGSRCILNTGVFSPVTNV